MMKIVYTICSANHLAQAITLGNSLLEHNENYKIIIGLTDKINNRFEIVEQLKKFEIIEAESLSIEHFNEMILNYNILELNCALKPYFALHIIEKYKLEKIIYLDSDIYVYHSFNEIENLLDTHSIIITPHFTNTLPEDGKSPLERDVLKSGLYNGGFFALKINDDSLGFLNWWKDKLKNQCYYSFNEGMGVDQIWLDYVPLFFKNVYIQTNKGYNVAYWNLHERKISKKNDQYYINEKEQLIFIHISGYNIKNPTQISKHQNRFVLEKDEILYEIFQNYYQKLLKNNHQYYAKLKCVYVKKTSTKEKIMASLNKYLKTYMLKIEILKAKSL